MTALQQFAAPGCDCQQGGRPGEVFDDVARAWAICACIPMAGILFDAAVTALERLQDNEAPR